MSSATRHSLLSLACALAASARGATYFCDPVSGGPHGDGSAARPWGALEEVAQAGLIRLTDRTGACKNPAAPVKASDTLLLRTGWHGSLRVDAGYNAAPLTVAAAPGESPQLGGVAIYDGSNWTLRGLTVSPSLAPAPDDRRPKDLVLLGERGGEACSNLVVEGCFIYSVLDASAWGAREWIEKPSGGILLGRGGRGHAARNNYVLNVRFGINLCAPGCAAEGNVVENFSGDGLRVTRSDASVRHNVIRNIFVSAADGDDNHDDGIQAFPFNRSKEPVRRARICENLIVACEDDALPLRAPMQGIGCFDGPLEGFVVAGNVICVNTWHGLSLYDAQSCVVSNNVVVSRWANREQPWIMLGAKQGLARGNAVLGNCVRNGVHARADPAARAEGNRAPAEGEYLRRRAELEALIVARYGAVLPAARRPRFAPPR